ARATDGAHSAGIRATGTAACRAAADEPTDARRRGSGTAPGRAPTGRPRLLRHHARRRYADAGFRSAHRYRHQRTRPGAAGTGVQLRARGVTGTGTSAAGPSATAAGRL